MFKGPAEVCLTVGTGSAFNLQKLHSMLEKLRSRFLSRPAEYSACTPKHNACAPEFNAHAAEWSVFADCIASAVEESACAAR